MILKVWGKGEEGLSSELPLPNVTKKALILQVDFAALSLSSAICDKAELWYNWRLNIPSFLSSLCLQHGFGQHIWFLQRNRLSQYSLRNTYEGAFEHGLRCGFGTFHYANGARYEGGWKDNMKHGEGKFIFKNGRVYEGQFENDHIEEFPGFTAEGVSTPDISQIRTRTPLPSGE